MKILKDLYPGNLSLTKYDIQLIRKWFAPSGHIMKEDIKGKVYIITVDLLKELKDKNLELHNKLLTWVNCMFVFGPDD